MLTDKRALLRALTPAKATHNPLSIVVIVVTIYVAEHKILMALKGHFRVVGTVKNPRAPVKICGPLSFCSSPPVFLVRPLS